MTDPTLHRLALATSAVVAGLIAVLTLMPPATVPGVAGGDKLHHFAGFAALVWPVAASRPRAALWAVPAAILFGGAIELIQPHVGRHGEWGDALANGLGAVIGAASGWAVQGLRRRAAGRGRPLRRRRGRG